MSLRIRRIAPRLPIGRAYQLEIPTDAGARRVTTRSPLSVLDPLLGVGDAWSIIHAADRAWDGRSGEWVSLHEPGDVQRTESSS